MFGPDCDPRQPVLFLSITLEKTNARIAHPNFSSRADFYVRKLKVVRTFC